MAVVSLALAIALNTTMYGVIDALVDPVVVMRAPEQLYWLGIYGDYRGHVDNATRTSMIRSTHFYEASASYQTAPFPAAIEYGQKFDQTPFAIVSPNLFTVVGVHPLFGRTFSDADFTVRTRLGAIYYLPDASDSTRVTGHRFSFHLVTRAKHDPSRMPITLKNAVHPLFPGAFVLSGSMEDALGITADRSRHDFVAMTFGAFAALALALAALGVYGIVAHAVAERKRELGVRIALGATARNVVGAILREGNAVALAGVALGLYLTKDTVIWLHAFSADGDEYDVVLFATMAAVLFLVAVLAALIPALRATQIDSVESLRSE